MDLKKEAWCCLRYRIKVVSFSYAADAKISFQNINFNTFAVILLSSYLYKEIAVL